MSRVRMRTSTTTMKKSWEYWTVLLMGLFYIATKCDARAVNVSNSWTMPQEGLNVFYRFFRDRISWFEADAVCQFHHAYLVTVDNSFQFDATRDLLRELDVNDIVWIGLMRPQSSDRFMWSNSKVLAANTGYWAESLPLMESPLCAVIDPIRDYRWHALRCGGPETASFLCEMPVPAWAESCILKDLPSLTMQYMADTASIELIRNCGEEGLIRQICRGKQDREKIMRELICPRERLESKKLTDITNSHFKSLQIIRGISTDNNENNDIEMIPVKSAVDSGEQVQTEKNTVQKLIEQFNVDELMQADQPSGIPGEIPMPVKKAAKKIVVAMQQKKPTPAPKKPMDRGNQKETDLDDMMVADQPMPDEDASNEVLEPLPHIKKVLPQDLKKMPTIKSTTIVEPATTTTSTVAVEIEQPSTPMPVQVHTSSESSALLDGTTTAEHMYTSGGPSTSSASLMTTTVSGIVPATQPATIGHPMHPQQQRTNIITEEANHPHIKETNDNHFIPPMLLVKSHYVPPAKGYEHEHEHPHTAPTPDQSDRDDETAETTIENVHQLEESNGQQQQQKQQQQQQQTTFASLQVGDTIAPQTVEEVVTIKVQDKESPAANSSEIQLQVTTTARAEMTTQDASIATQPQSTIKPATTPESQPEPEAVATTTFTAEKTTDLIIPTTGSGDVTSINRASSSTSSQTMLPSSSSSTASVLHQTEADATVDVTSSQAPLVHTIDTQTEGLLMNTEKTDQLPQQSTPFVAVSTSGSSSSSSSSSNTGDSMSPPLSALPASTTTEGSGIISLTTATATKAAQHEEPQPTRNFLNEETYPPFKPNRRRSLTKPDTPSYFKKILG
ncbi:mucin-2 [Eupeodes corollae]|uniref:mucin-2 n=1 Tax=Eupeodes corollae TaxID=290404 RepID=UPI0024900428|nr:mucin-2 [Eupeodes corollae]